MPLVAQSARGPDMEPHSAARGLDMKPRSNEGKGVEHESIVGGEGAEEGTSGGWW